MKKLNNAGERKINSTKEARNRINREIRSPKLRLIDAEGKQLGIVSFTEALQSAQDAELDLVEIQPNAEPPVARIMDYGKHLFESKKKHSKKKQKVVKLKEQKFRPTTDTNDYMVKVRNLRSFLEKGNRVKVTVWFRGREMAHQKIGFTLLERIKKDLEDISKVEFFPKLEGRQLVMILAPSK